MLLSQLIHLCGPKNMERLTRYEYVVIKADFKWEG